MNRTNKSAVYHGLPTLNPVIVAFCYKTYTPASFVLDITMDSSSSNVQVVLCATLEGHKDAVTAIAAPADPTAKFIVSASRGMLSFHLFFNGWMSPPWASPPGHKDSSVSFYPILSLKRILLICPTCR